MNFMFVLFLVSQLHVAISQNQDHDRLGLGPRSPLLSSLKQRIVELASKAGIIATVQMAAQATLQTGWSMLLPTAEERAKALSALLPSGGKHWCLDVVVIRCSDLILLKSPNQQ